MKDLSLFVILYSLVVMTVLCSYSGNKVGDEFNFNAQAQVIENSQQPQQQLPSSLTTSPQTGMMPAIKITSHSSGQQVKAGSLTISGTSSDTPSTECEVYADWNDSIPFRKAVADGSGGPGDYSRWTFTYDSGYQLIQNGTNNLTSKISCINGSTNLTKWNSINLIGVNGSDSPSPTSSTSGSVINQAITGGPASSPSPTSSTAGLPLPTPSQADITSPPLDPVVDEVNDENEDDEEGGNDNDDSDSDDSNDEDDEEDNNEEDNNEEDNNEEDEDNNSSEDEDSEDNGDGENGDGDADDGDGDDGDDDNFFGGDPFFDD